MVIGPPDPQLLHQSWRFESLASPTMEAGGGALYHSTNSQSLRDPPKGKAILGPACRGSHPRAREAKSQGEPVWDSVPTQLPVVGG